jgi:hypothetical protein
MIKMNCLKALESKHLRYNSFFGLPFAYLFRCAGIKLSFIVCSTSA